MFGTRTTREEYEELAKLSAKINLNDLKNSEIGKFVLCECREENATRLYIHRFDLVDDLFKKDGWWDTFTISNSPCKEKGYYLCEIQNFRLDRNGFLNMMVSPKHYIGIDADAESDAWDYFFTSGLFTRHYRSSSINRTRFNVEALHKLYEGDIHNIIATEKERLGDNYISAGSKITKFIMDKYINGEISLIDIEKALDEKSDLEKLADDLTTNVKHYGSDAKNKYVSNYPLLVKKLPVEEYGLCKGYYTTDATIRYLNRKDFEYAQLHLGNETDLLKRVEAVLRYWVDIKMKEKEEKKRKRKENKLKKDS